MRRIGVSDAKTHLLDLLKQASEGESFLITSRGKPVAVLSPAGGSRERVMAFRKKFAGSLKSFSVDEIAALKSVGRR